MRNWKGFSEPLQGPAFSIARGSLPGRSVECRKGFLVLPGVDTLSFFLPLRVQSALHIRRFCIRGFNQLCIEFLICLLVESTDAKTCRYKRWTKQFLKPNDRSQAMWRLDLYLNSKSLNSLNLPPSYKDVFILTSLKWHLRRRKVKIFNKGKFLFLPWHGETTVDID